MKTSLVLGAGFGDEGKGVVTSFLASLSPPEETIVARFNGTSQAGHHVVIDHISHIFSSFGSGTLQGAATWWTKYCAFSPMAFMNEYDVLKELVPTMPKIYIDPLCPVITPYDRVYNQEQEKENPNGSVGVGFGATMERHEKLYRLYFQDLFNVAVLHGKLMSVQAYYRKNHAVDLALQAWLQAVDELRELQKNGVIQMGQPWLHGSSPLQNVIFEGAQGILLDQEFGFYPNVTWSYTTSRNALELCRQHNLPAPDTYYVTRAYSTRHGIGFMPNELHPKAMLLKNNENETNVDNEWQGPLRYGFLDADLLGYAIACDLTYNKGRYKNLVITCVDQLRSPDRGIPIVKNGEFQYAYPNDIPKLMNHDIDNLYVSHGPSYTNISKLK